MCWSLAGLYLRKLKLCLDCERLQGKQRHTGRPRYCSSGTTRAHDQRGCCRAETAGMTALSGEVHAGSQLQACHHQGCSAC